MRIRLSTRQARRRDLMAFVAILVTAIILISVGQVEPLAVKVLTDLAAAYWAVSTAANRPAAPVPDADCRHATLR